MSEVRQDYLADFAKIFSQSIFLHCLGVDRRYRNQTLRLQRTRSDGMTAETHSKDGGQRPPLQRGKAPAAVFYGCAGLGVGDPACVTPRLEDLGTGEMRILSVAAFAVACRRRSSADGPFGSGVA